LPQNQLYSVQSTHVKGLWVQQIFDNFFLQCFDTVGWLSAVNYLT